MFVYNNSKLLNSWLHMINLKNILRPISTSLTVAVMLFASAPVFADTTLVYDFTAGQTGNLGTSTATYTAGGIPIVAHGSLYSSNGMLTSANLYNSVLIVNNGALGLENDGIGQTVNQTIRTNTDNNNYYIQLDITLLLEQPNLTSLTLTITGSGATYNILEASAINSTPPLRNMSLESGTAIERPGGQTISLLPLPTLDFLLITSSSLPETTFGIYLSKLTATFAEVAVPEPSTYLILGSTLGMALLIQLRKRKQKATSALPLHKW